MTTRAPSVPTGCRAFLAGLLCTLCVLWATTAQAAPKRIGVPKFDGVQEALVRKKVMQILKSHGYDLAKSREMEIGLANTGALLDNDEGFQKVAKELALAAIVTGEIGKKRAKLAVHDGKDGSLLGEANFAGANPRKIMAEVARGFWTKLGSAVEQGKTPSGAKKPQKVVAEAPEDDENAPDAGGGGEGESEPPPPAPEPRSKKKTEAVAEAEGGGAAGDEAPPPAKKKKKKKKIKMEGEGADVVEEDTNEVIPPTIDVQAGFGLVNRNLAYHQDVSNPNLRTYGLPAGFAAVFNAVAYPIALFTDGPMKNLGFEANVEQAFFIASPLPAMGATPAQKFGNTVHEFSGGVRYRVPFGAGHYFYGSATGGEHAFTFNSIGMGNRANLDIPDVIYRYIRPGIGIHFELPAQFSLTLSGGYRWIFNGAGPQFHDTFWPNSTVAGVDGELAIGYRIQSWGELRVVGGLRRYFSSMNCASNMNGTVVNTCMRTLPNGTPVDFTVGGAVDQYISAGAVFAVNWGGSEIKMPEEAEEAPPPPKRKRKHAEDEDSGGGDSGGDSGGGGDDQ
ncbi:MAG TPA: hypothetical protein VKQ32_10575 [Polyangia bacterium]|nr:hypothetical protein [Polyangia bacterium]